MNKYKATDKGKKIKESQRNKSESDIRRKREMQTV